MTFIRKITTKNVSKNVNDIYWVGIIFIAVLWMSKL